MKFKVMLLIAAALFWGSTLFAQDTSPSLIQITAAVSRW